jgi:DNA recombination protein RmuC
MIETIIIIFFMFYFIYQQKQNSDLNSRLYKENYILRDKFLEKLQKFEELQIKLDYLCNNILTLQDILNDKKSRGTFGELQLNDIISDIFGNNKKFYEIQHVLPNKYKVDVIVFNQNGNIPIDSKFPLENYKRIVDNNITENVKKEFIKLFKQDIKKHINDISSKYIAIPYTTQYAILFIPSESVFSKVYEFEDLIKYARQKNICITSPSTIIPLLSTLKFFNLNNKNNDITSFLSLEKINNKFEESNNNLHKIIKNIDTASSNLKKLQMANNNILNDFKNLLNLTENVKTEEK